MHVAPGMELRTLFPEAIPGPFAWVYSLGPGRFLRTAQERIAESACAALSVEGLPPRVLDVGCGPGWLAINIARRRPDLRVIAIDLSHEMTRIAGRNAKGLDNVEIRRESAAELSLADGSIAMAVSSESMHHWRDPVRVLDELHRVLAPGGRAWIFDGRDDFDESDMREWLAFGPAIPKGRIGHSLLRIPRAVLSTHGFKRDQWEHHVPDLLRRSRFGGGDITPIGIYRRIELVRAK